MAIGSSSYTKAGPALAGNYMVGQRPLKTPGRLSELADMLYFDEQL